MEIFNPFLDILPNIDIHGYTKDMVYCTLNEFIDDNIKIKNYKIVIIHGKGEHILKDEVHRLLKLDKRVEKYYLDGFNTGVTVIELRKDI